MQKYLFSLYEHIRIAAGITAENRQITIAVIRPPVLLDFGVSGNIFLINFSNLLILFPIKFIECGNSGGSAKKQSKITPAKNAAEI